jgi:uncharacterized membrane protein YGL010W
MKSVQEHMSFYEAYHKHPLNKLTHFIGIPMIVFSILVPLSWPAIPVAGYAVTAAMALIAVVLTYYTLLDRAFGIAMALVLIPLLFAAHQVGQAPYLTGGLVFVGFFVVGWIIQIIGHVVFEKRRPALVDNLFQMVIGPLFLCAELFFMLGFKQELHQEVVQLSRRFTLDQHAA